MKDGISERYLWPEFVNELTDEKLLEAPPEWWRRQWISWHWQTAELIRNSLDLFRALLCQCESQEKAGIEALIRSVEAANSGEPKAPDRR